jgi:hypothetical protein
MARTTNKKATQKKPTSQAKRTTRTQASRRPLKAVAKRKQPARRVLLMVATRKGAWLFHGDAARRTWRVDGPHFLGHIIGQHRPPRADDVSFHRSRPHLEGSKQTARVSQGT